MYNSIAEAVIENGKKYPKQTALADAAGTYSYEALSQMIIKTAGWLEHLNMGEESCVLVECTQDASFVILDLACELSGKVFVPLEKKAKTERVAAIRLETGASCIIGATDYSDIGRFFFMKDVIESAKTLSLQPIVFPKREKTAEILFTTGTTGMPKGIVLSHKANLAIAENIGEGVGIRRGTAEMIPMPLSHSHGLRTCYANLFAGSTVVICDGVINVGLFFHMLEQYAVNALDISPTLAKLLLKIAPSGLKKYADSIEYIEIGTAALEDATKDRLKEIFPNTRLYNFYGSTEAGRSCVLDFQHFDETGCIGYPAKNARFYIVDDNRKEIKSSKNNPGLIAVSGDMMMEGYLNSPELTKRTLADGVLYTSDMGYLDEDGRVYVLGRQDDIINYKGIKIAPEEIEQVAERYDGILDCACIPKEDPVCGQVPKLYIRVSDQSAFRMEDFTDYLKTALERERIPSLIEFADEIPRSSNGKILRKKLRVRNEK